MRSIGALRIWKKRDPDGQDACGHVPGRTQALFFPVSLLW